MKKFYLYISAIFAGLINGLLGAGGGMIIVPALLNYKLDRKQVHANSVCIIFCMCVLSTIIYINSNNVAFQDTIPYLIWGVIGSVAGSLLLDRMNPNILKKMFGLFSMWAAYRLFTR